MSCRTAYEILENSQNVIELYPSAHSSSQNEYSQKSPEKQKLNFSHTLLFHKKTIVCVKHFVHDSSILKSFSYI